MPRPRNPNRARAAKIWFEHNGNITNREIAELLGENEKVIAVWKHRDRWSNVVQRTNDSCTTNDNADDHVHHRSSKTESTHEDASPHNATLTDKQRIFIDEYLVHFNATRAAIAAGYSRDTAYSIGWENLRKPEIQSAIKERTEAQLFNLGITQERVLTEYLKIAYANITDYVEFGQREVPVMDGDTPQTDDDGNIVTRKVNFVSLRESGEVDGSLVHEVKQGRDGFSIKMYDKMKALEALSRYTDLLPDDHKRRIDEEKLRLEKARLELEQRKSF